MSLVIESRFPLEKWPSSETKQNWQSSDLWWFSSLFDLVCFRGCHRKRRLIYWGSRCLIGMPSVFNKLRLLQEMAEGWERLSLRQIGTFPFFEYSSLRIGKAKKKRKCEALFYGGVISGDDGYIHNAIFCLGFKYHIQSKISLMGMLKGNRPCKQKVSHLLQDDLHIDIWLVYRQI